MSVRGTGPSAEDVELIGPNPSVTPGHRFVETIDHGLCDGIVGDETAHHYNAGDRQLVNTPASQVAAVIEFTRLPGCRRP